MRSRSLRSHSDHEAFASAEKKDHRYASRTEDSVKVGPTDATPPAALQTTPHLRPRDGGEGDTNGAEMFSEMLHKTSE